MSQESFGPAGWEGFNPDDIAEIESNFDQTMEANYRDNLAVFRADVFQLLEKLNGISDGYGWAYFQMYSPEQEAGDDGGLIQDVFVGVSRVKKEDDFDGYSWKKDESISPPQIRIIVNEQVTDGNGETLWITKDFIADHEGNCQYHINVFDPLMDMDDDEDDDDEIEQAYTGDDEFDESELSSGHIIETENADEETEYDYDDESLSATAVIEPFRAPIVIVNEERQDIVIHNAGVYPSMPQVSSYINEDEFLSAMPFGRYEFLEDRIHALDFGKAIFNEINTLQPSLVMKRVD